MEGQYKVEQVGKDLYQIGEGPHWDDQQQSLYYIDITASLICRYDAITQTTYKATVADAKTVGFMIPVKKTDDQFIIGADNKIVLIKWNGKSDSVSFIKELACVVEPENGRLNDGKCDFSGRLVAGTMLIDWASSLHTHKGVLVTYSSKDNSLPITRLTKVGLSNGLAWNKDKNKMYYADSIKYNVTEYDYDEATGAVGSGRLVFDVKSPSYGLPEGCLPDGLTIDSEGHLWIALFLASRVVQVDVTSGLILTTVMIPTPQVTSVCFGGRNLDVLFVTTCSKGPHGDSLPAPAGGIFKVTGVQAKGLPANAFSL